MLPTGPKKDLIKALAQKARYVIAVGTCASFGGIGLDSPTMAGGLQFTKWEMGGLLGQEWRSSAGCPVINLPGCPCHCDVVVGTLSALAEEAPPALGHYNTPVDWYGIMVHQGCTRNEYHEYRVEEKKFGEKGCLFFYMGCHGPLVTGPVQTKPCGIADHPKRGWASPALVARGLIFPSFTRFLKPVISKAFPLSCQMVSAGLIIWPIREWPRLLHQKG